MTMSIVLYFLSLSTPWCCQVLSFSLDSYPLPLPSPDSRFSSDHISRILDFTAQSVSCCDLFFAIPSLVFHVDPIETRSNVAIMFDAMW
jgi:hypothetical protein